jgi:hypothetical protein
MHTRRVFGCILLIAILAISLVAAAQAQSSSAQEVLTWNETTMKAAVTGGHDPRQVTRPLTMVQGAVHDVLNAITPGYAAYYFEGPAEAGASPNAAVATAAHTVLMGVIPSFGTTAQKIAASAIYESGHGR